MTASSLSRAMIVVPGKLFKFAFHSRGKCAVYKLTSTKKAAEYLKKPFIVVYPTAFNLFGLLADVPLPPSYVPVITASDRMTITQRIINFLSSSARSIVLQKLFDFYFKEVLHHYNITKNFEDLFAQAEMHLVNSDFALEFAHPLMPSRYQPFLLYCFFIHWFQAAVFFTRISFRRDFRGSSDTSQGCEKTQIDTGEQHLQKWSCSNGYRQLYFRHCLHNSIPDSYQSAAPCIKP